MDEYAYIGKSIPQVDGPHKVTGKAFYSSDIKLPGMHYGKCKRSPHPFARILSIDTSRAARLPGVIAVITAQNVHQNHFGEFVFDQYPLCSEYVHYAGDEVAAVAAVDEATAEEAVELIQVNYEVLTPVFEPEKALEREAPLVHPELESTLSNNVAYAIDFQRGEGEGAFRDAEIIVEERFTTQTQHQCYLQPRDCVAEWKGDHLTLWAANQSPFRMRIPIAHALGIPESNIRIIPGYVGGGFGNNASRLWPITALLAKASGTPVKLTLTREEDFETGRPFPSTIAHIKLGLKKDGRMIAKKLNLCMNGGAYVGSGRAVLAVASSRCDNIYRIPNIAVSSKLIYTNTIPRGCLRSVGNYLGAYIMESTVDIAAEKLGIDPVEIRLINASQKGDCTVHGFELNSCGFSDSLKTAREKSGWQNKKKSGNKYHGIGVAGGIHVTGNRTFMPMFEGSAAIVRINENGEVEVISGEQNLGQGSETIFAQITAEELGIPIDYVKVSPVDTSISPFAKGTYGSRVTVMGGSAVKIAAVKAKKELFTWVSRVLHCNEESLELYNGDFKVKGSDAPAGPFQQIARQAVLLRSGLPILGTGNYNVPDSVVVGGPQQDYYGNNSIAYTFLTQIAEVIVDTETGGVAVTDFWAAVDIGRAINPKACEGQMEGGIGMGLGYALSEKYQFDKGIILNPNFTDYKIPTASAMPEVHTYFLETGDPLTLYGAKSIGEAVINPVAPAVANAIKDAIGIRVKDLPITPWKIKQALMQISARQD